MRSLRTSPPTVLLLGDNLLAQAGPFDRHSSRHYGTLGLQDHLVLGFAVSASCVSMPVASMG